MTPALRALTCVPIALLVLAAPAIGAPNPAAAPTAQAAPLASRHALIIGVGEYDSNAIRSLKGVGHDIASATRMALAMQVPPQQILVLRDHEASSERIAHEIAELNKRVQPGDRVFFYFSGHGTRWQSAASANSCVEALLPADGRGLSNDDLAALLSPIAEKTDKLFVFYDACHSGGVVGQMRSGTRSLGSGTSLTPKFTDAGMPNACSKVSNMKTRAFAAAAQRKGALPENIVQISSSRPDEVSFDDENGGGMATQAWRDCLLGDAKDLDASGATTVDEVTACAQARIDAHFANNPIYGTQHFTIGGNKSFVPARFAAAFEPAAPLESPAPAAPAASSALAAPVAALPALRDVYAQRDPRRKVGVKPNARFYRINKDAMSLQVTSSHAGYVYVVMLDSKSTNYYLLFPNDKDHDNHIAAGGKLQLPRPGWAMMSEGPAGIDHMLVMVTDTPRDLSLLGNVKAGPFVQSLTDSSGRSNLQWLLSNSANQADPECSGKDPQRGGAPRARCSDAYGAAMAELVERQ